MACRQSSSRPNLWAVDPDRDPLDLGVRAGRRSRVEDDRSAAVLGQVLLDRTGDDPAYKTDGGDTFAYQIPLATMTAPPAKVSATLYYQAIPPFFLQDRFCIAKGTDVDRLRFVTSLLRLDGQVAGWKLNMVSTGPVTVQ